MRLVEFVVLHLARQSKLGQLLPVTSALVMHCPSINVSSQQPSGVVKSTLPGPTCAFSIIIANTFEASRRWFHKRADTFHIQALN